MLRGVNEETFRVRGLYRNPPKKRADEGRRDVSGRCTLSKPRAPRSLLRSTLHRFQQGGTCLGSRKMPSEGAIVPKP